MFCCAFSVHLVLFGADLFISALSIKLIYENMRYRNGHHHRMFPWWSVCTLYLSHGRWSYHRRLGSLRSMCDVNCSSAITSHCLLIPQKRSRHHFFRIINLSVMSTTAMEVLINLSGRSVAQKNVLFSSSFLSHPLKTVKYNEYCLKLTTDIVTHCDFEFRPSATRWLYVPFTHLA